MRYLTAAQAAAKCHLSISALSVYRHEGTGPRWVRVGAGHGRILYVAADVSRWIVERLGRRLHLDQEATSSAAKYDAAVARVEFRLMALEELSLPWSPRLRHALWGLRAAKWELDRLLERVERIKADLTPDGLEARVAALMARHGLLVDLPRAAA